MQNAKKRLSNLPIGSVIRFQSNGVEHEYIKHAPAFQFKRPFWYNIQKNKYIQATRIPFEFDIVKGEVAESN